MWFYEKNNVRQLLMKWTQYKIKKKPIRSKYNTVNWITFERKTLITIDLYVATDHYGVNIWNYSIQRTGAPDALLCV